MSTSQRSILWRARLRYPVPGLWQSPARKRIYVSQFTLCSGEQNIRLRGVRRVTRLRNQCQELPWAVSTSQCSILWWARLRYPVPGLWQSPARKRIYVSQFTLCSIEQNIRLRGVRRVTRLRNQCQKLPWAVSASQRSILWRARLRYPAPGLWQSPARKRIYVSQFTLCSVEQNIRLRGACGVTCLSLRKRSCSWIRRYLWRDYLYT